METQERIEQLENWIDYYNKQYEKTRNQKYPDKIIELNEELIKIKERNIWNNLISPIVFNKVISKEQLKKMNEHLKKIAPDLLKDYSAKLVEQAKHLKPIGTKFKVGSSEISIISTPYIKGDDIYMMSDTPDGKPVFIKGENKDESKKDSGKS